MLPVAQHDICMIIRIETKSLKGGTARIGVSREENRFWTRNSQKETNMSEQETMEIRGLFRSHSHLPIWEVMEKAGIWEKNGLKVSFEFCDSSEAAEKALFGGDVDFVSGNHISPYLLVKRGKPIVCLSSPSNSVNDRLVTRFAVKQVSELRGKRIGDTTLVDSIGGYHHPRGNHMLYVMRGGLKLDDVA